MERTEVAYGDENNNMLVTVLVIWLCSCNVEAPIALVVVLAAECSVVPCASHRSYSAIAKLPDSYAMPPQYVALSIMALPCPRRRSAIGCLGRGEFAHHFD